MPNSPTAAASQQPCYLTRVARILLNKYQGQWALRMVGVEIPSRNVADVLRMTPGELFVYAVCRGVFPFEQRPPQHALKSPSDMAYFIFTEHVRQLNAVDDEEEMTDADE